MQVRRARMQDVIEMQHCNLRCLPENYNLRYYYYHYLSWPQDLFVLEDVNNQIAGYVLAKVDDEEDVRKRHGHITSLAVLRSHRKLGAASALMRSSMQEMREVDDANFCSLHVRQTNAAALHLYQGTLKFRCVEVESKYYLDDEDAYHMKRFFKMPGLETGDASTSKEKQVKIAYVTPHGDMKWTKLDADQLRSMNADIPNYVIPGMEKEQQQSNKKNSGAASSSSPSAEQQKENNTSGENKNANNNNAGGKKKKQQQSNDADIEAQLAALGEGGNSGNKNNKKKGGKK